MRRGRRSLAVAATLVALAVLAMPTGAATPASPPRHVTVPPALAYGPRGTAAAASIPRPSTPLPPHAWLNTTLAPGLLPARPSTTPAVSALQLAPVPRPPATTPVVKTFLAASSTCCVSANFTAPVGSWAMIVLNYTGQAVGGIYDSSFRAYIDQVQVSFGTTPEYGQWTTLTDVTRYESLLQGTYNFTFLLAAATTGGYFLTSVSLSFYPVPAGGVPPVEPNLIVPLFHRIFVSATTPTVTATATVPTTAWNATLELWTYAEDADEFWYAGEPNFREMNVAVDGTALAAVYPFPYINTGGDDPFMWRPITGVFTLEDRPYDLDVTGALGLLEGMHTYTANITDVVSGGNWLIGAALLVFTNSTVTGATLQHAAVSLPAPTTSTDHATYYTQHQSTSLSFASAVAARAGVENVSSWENESFANDFALATDWENITASEVAFTHVHADGFAGMTDTNRSFTVPLTLDLGSIFVETSSTNGGYPIYGNFTTLELGVHQEWNESTVTTGPGGIVLARATVDYLVTGGTNELQGKEELTSPTASLLLAISYVASATNAAYTQDLYGGRLDAGFQHLITGSALQPSGPNYVESISVNAIDSPLRSLLVASTPQVDVGQAVTLATSAVGGDGAYAYSYTGLPPGCASNGTAALTCRPTSAGPYPVTVVVTDHGLAAAPSEVTLFVNPAPALVPASAPSAADVGTTVWANVTTQGGSGAFRCVWTVNGSAAVNGSCSAGFSFAPTAPGSYTVNVTATDALGGRTAPLLLSIDVVAAPQLVLLAGSPLNVSVGRSVNLTTRLTGGIEPVAFTWYLNGSPVAGISGPAWTFTPSGAGQYTVGVAAVDAAGVRSFGGDLTVTATAVGSSPHSPSGGGGAASPMPWAVALGIGLVVGAAAGAIAGLVLGRRRPPNADTCA